MLIGSDHAAAEDAENAFHSVCRSIAANILTLAMVYALMAGETLANGLVARGIVSAQVAIAMDEARQNFVRILAAEHGDIERADLSATFHKRQNFQLVTMTTRAALTHNLRAIADIHFVGFDHLSGTA